MARRYAEGTQVSVQSSQGEIAGILMAHGVRKQGWMSSPEGDELMFELEGHSFRFQIFKPTLTEIRALYPNTYDERKKLDAEWRRRWRANVLLLKAKLEFADGEASTVVRELMPYALLVDGRTLEEAILAGDSVPLLGTGR